jgi:hypothetical protein
MLLDIDLGFEVIRHQRIRLARIDADVRGRSGAHLHEREQHAKSASSQNLRAAFSVDHRHDAFTSSPAGCA